MQCNLIDFAIMGDERGNLISLEETENVPFEIKRVYFIYNTDTTIKRGMHAHRDLKQLVLCVKGSCKFLLDDSKKKVEILLDQPNRGLLIEGLIWREMFDFSSDCILIIFANKHFNEQDYIRDYEEFVKIAVEKEHVA